MTIPKSATHKALDLVEYIIKTGPDESIKELIQYLNWSFKKENVGYRVIGKEITPITTPIEIDSINEALQTPYQSITTLFDTALSLLSSKTNPDYRNSIKESISAVEAICKLISGKSNGTLGKALKTIGNKHPIPPALQEGLSKIYGYTSASGGIRHALIKNDTTPTFADAQFMLVSCSAFVNYLVAIAAERNIPLEG